MSDLIVNPKKYAARIAYLEAELASTKVALYEAAESLNTLATQAGNDEYLHSILQIRGYANSRATVAREALQKGGTR